MFGFFNNYKLINISRFVSIQSCSITCKGHSFEQALIADDKNIDCFYSAVESNIPLPHYLTLDLKKEHVIKKIIITWEGEENNCKKCKIIALNNDTHHKKSIVFDNLRGYKQLYNLSKNFKTKNLKIIFADFNGQQRVLLRKIDIYVEL
jgi:hypothetical protein